MAATLALSARAYAQVQITELMVDTLGANEDAWEWIEVRNTGATPIDLNGYIADRLGDEEFVSISIDAGLAANTMIPAGGVAVIYDGDHPLAAADYNDALFRTAWGLSPSVPLIAARNFPALTNSGGTAIGFWPDAGSYSLDLANLDADEDLEVASFNNASFSLDFRTISGFPGSTSGVSLRWNGQGSHTDGANWGPTTSGVTSMPATLPGNVNSTDDVGNPGLFPSGTPGTGLFFTEIMYNPSSDDADWEWVEIFNNTGATIDFGATPYVFDDDDDSALAAANVTSGAVPDDAGAVLFNASSSGITLSDMQAAWDPDGTRGINFIGVTPWSTALANGGDQVALWPSLSAYTSEANTASGTRTMDNAASVVTYNDEAGTMEGVTGTWPTDNGDGSIRLIDFGNDPTVGESWALSTTIDGFSFSAAGISGTITIHPGGDLGTPGTFGVETANDADFDGDNDVDGNDFLIWQRGLGVGATNGTGDADGNGVVDAADLAVWRTQFGGPPAVSAASAVPEPMTLALGGLAILALSLSGRSRRAK